MGNIAIINVVGKADTESTLMAVGESETEVLAKNL